MIDRIKGVDSVGSAAVQAGIDHLEQHLAQMLRHAAEAAERDRVATIKPRHLDRALLNMKPAEGAEDDENAPEVSAADDFVASQAGGLVTPTALLSMAKSIARMGVSKARSTSCSFSTLRCWRTWKKTYETMLNSAATPFNLSNPSTPCAA